MNRSVLFNNRDCSFTNGGGMCYEVKGSTDKKRRTAVRQFELNIRFVNSARPEEVFPSSPVKDDCDDNDND